MEQVITIDKKLSPENAEKVLWHEACHAAFALSGASEHLSQETEEMLAIMLENAFYDIVDVWKLSVKNN